MQTREAASEAHSERADTECLGGGKWNETYIIIPLTSIKNKVPQKTPAFFPRTHTHKRTHLKPTRIAIGGGKGNAAQGDK